MFSLIQTLGPIAIVPVFQHTPLMISATRPEIDAAELVDRASRNYRVETVGREQVLIQTAPLSLVDQLDDLKSFGARNFRIDLCYGVDSAEEASDVVRRILAGSDVPGSDCNFSRGLS